MRSNTKTNRSEKRWFMLYREFYSELAKLFYAVARIDGKISKAEKEELKKIVREEMVPAEKHVDRFGTDAAYYTEIEFDFLEDTIVDPEAAFVSFTEYIEKHHSAITPPMRDLCLRISKRIAQRYHGKSKKEHKLIKRLEVELASLPVNGH